MADGLGSAASGEYPERQWPAPGSVADGGRARRARGRRRYENEQLRLRQIVRTLVDGVVLVDSEGIIRFANPAAEKLLNRSHDALLGSQFGFPILRGEAEEIDIISGPDGPVVAELRAVETEWDGEPMRLVSLRDITDRKRSEERALQLEAEQRARLESDAASRAKSEFLAIMSHELRTPLNAILGYAELLKLELDGRLAEKQCTHIERIQASGRHLLSLVNEVLDLAKIEGGKLSIERKVCDALSCAKSAVALNQPQADAQGVRLGEITLDGQPPTFLGDEERVLQILTNLLSNAIKFSLRGGRIVMVVGTTRSPEHQAGAQASSSCTFFRVMDTGIGIPADRLESIFEPFTQIDSGKTRRREGTGLGLTISRHLARLMGGDITVRSRLDRGSTFTLWLPTSEASDQGSRVRCSR